MSRRRGHFAAGLFIGRGIVDDDDPCGLVRARQERLEAGEQLVTAIVGGDDRVHLHAVIRGGFCSWHRGARNEAATRSFATPQPIE